MAHQLYNQSLTVMIETDDEAIFDLLPNDGAGYSILRQLWAKIYGSMTISFSMLPQFRNELDQLLDELKEQLTPKMVRQHKVTATDPAIAGPIVDGLLMRDPLYSKLKQMVALCDDSLDSKQSIECIGD